jgi:hypothetical protein
MLLRKLLSIEGLPRFWLGPIIVQMRLFFTTTEENRFTLIRRSCESCGPALYSGWARIGRVVGRLGEFVLCDLALSLGRSQPNR